MSQTEDHPQAGNNAAGKNPSNEMWRSMKEWENTPEFQALVKKEFPAADADQLGPVDRRRFLQLIGASAALASASSCRYEKEELLPFADRPEGYVPGDRRLYSSAFERDGVALPLHVDTVDGRPIKIDGNPNHKASGGASDTQSQAAILEFYDPDRSRGVQHFVDGTAEASTWQAALDALKSALEGAQGDGGRVAVLSAASASPALHGMRQRFMARFPNARWAQWAAGSSANPTQGANLAAGVGADSHMRVMYHLDRARTILSLDADFLQGHADGVRHSAEFARGRQPQADMNRLYSVESRYTRAGASADHRLPLAPSAIANFVQVLEQELATMGLKEVAPASPTALSEVGQKFARALADDLWKNRGQAVIIAGDHLPAEVHARVLALNEKLNAVNKTMTVYPAPVELDPAGSAGLEDIVGAMASGSIDTLLVLGGNPAYDAPGNLDLEAALAQVKNSVHLSVYANETSQLCAWHLPMAHFLESWGDARSYDGTYTVVQPTIAPLFGGKSAIEVLSNLVDTEPLDGLALVRRSFDAQATGQAGGDEGWRTTVRDGMLAGSASSALSLSFASGSGAKLSAAAGGMDLVLYPCPKVGDGRFANNGWLQELPDYLTKLTWDNVLLVSVSDAGEMGIDTGDVVTVTANGASVDAPAYVAPGQAAGSLGLAMGYGRTAAGRIGGDRKNNVDPVGVDVAPLRTTANPHMISGVQLAKTGKVYPLATTQEHHLVDTAGMEAREERMGALIRTGTKAEYDSHPDFQAHAVHHPPLNSLWEHHEYNGYKWGMAIDLSTCDGCNACVIACQAENNIPIVGKDQVAKGREMHWIRIDAYYRGDPESPTVAHQPVACAHCEMAPCEQVCPVAATVHSDEGLNDMVYNRCVGTRYCGNNCPYKVRRFNYFHYPKRFFGHEPELMGLANNPSVTVRSRGVMEKCTYCVQRIQEVKIDARNEDRAVVDGEIQTACEAACPPNAIVFGDLNNPTSKVAQAQAGPRSYAMLQELNIHPRTEYLARVTNPNPALAPAETHSEASDH